MIECKKVSFSYPPNETDIGDREGHGTLRNIDLSINDGDFVLLCGTSGCGKTTLTRLFNGLIPHYYDGKLEGTVMLDGEDMRGLSLFDISKKVGSVFQNPRSQFFNVDTPKELFNLLADDYRTYVEIELTKGRRELTEDDEREADALCKRYLERWRGELE